MSSKANAEPTKDFFVRMITRDISLEDCILDLVDNCVDGASKHVSVRNPTGRSLKGFQTNIEFSENGFRISDNCGGITLSDALDYAFRFGRRADAPLDSEFGIGLYGIGMKRAIFKIGNLIEVRSKTEKEGFVVPINVENWLTHQDWDFELEELTENIDEGTVIDITKLHPAVAREFNDPVFESKLRKIIGRDYSFILDDGFSISVNGKPVKPHSYKLRSSESFQPLKLKYEDDGVEVEISAGLAGVLPDDFSPELVDKPNVDFYGWFVSCNERIVIAGSKQADTVWGVDGFAKWHPQYNGFMGIVNFNAINPSLLPWTTTKREIDTQSPLYKRALTKMRSVTRRFIDYSNERKENLEKARQLERGSKLTDLSELGDTSEMKLPRISSSKVKKANIGYSVELDLAKKVAKVLGNGNMAYRQIGLKTFEYFVDAEVEASDE